MNDNTISSHLSNYGVEHYTISHAAGKTKIKIDNIQEEKIKKIVEEWNARHGKRCVLNENHEIEINEATLQEMLRSSTLSKDSFPELDELLQLIKNYTRSNNPVEDSLHSDYINFLYVLAGLKPVLVVERCPDEQRAIFQKIAKEFPHISTAVDTWENLYLINEHPLPEFDPRNFIADFDKKYKSIQEAVCNAFPNQNQAETDQLLSYLLGFGPTWETYASGSRRGYLENCRVIFSDEHYYQLGKAQNDKLSRGELIELGKKISHDLITIVPKRNILLEYDELPEVQRIVSLWVFHKIGPPSFHTDYIEQGMKYREELLKLYDIPPYT